MSITPFALELIIRLELHDSINGLRSSGNERENRSACLNILDWRLSLAFQNAL